MFYCHSDKVEDTWEDIKDTAEDIGDFFDDVADDVSDWFDETADDVKDWFVSNSSFTLPETIPIRIPLTIWY